MKMFEKMGWALALTMGLTAAAHAVPVLQVGAPAGAGDSGSYADYLDDGTHPTEEDTAFTSGSTILVAGVYQNKNVVSLGSQSSGGDYGDADADFSMFNGHGAILLAAVPDGTLASALASLTVDGNSAFLSSTTLDGLFPNNHDPLKDGVSDFLFFDIGDFAKNIGVVPDFDPETGAANGEIKSLTIAGTAGLDWIHFDVLALETSENGGTTIRTTIAIENNPGSHDLTWKPGDDDDDDDDDDLPPESIPEPSLMGLLGLGLAIFGLAGLRRRS